jgi:vitamin B12/bleomycin/antimicrobial peptide transport system ATP-binding/permease protein
LGETADRERRSGRARRFLLLAMGFWTGPTRARAWLLSVLVIVFLVWNLGSALAVNFWTKYFFDALERRNTDHVLLGIGLIAAIALASAAGSVGLLQARMRLQVRWRQWLSRALIRRWLADRHFYQLTIVQTEAENPEARIAEDSRLAIELMVDFSVGLLNALLAAASFIGILWVVGGSFTVLGVAIPGYMVFACVMYSAVTTLGMFLLARPLVRRVEQKAAVEAQLRYELTRVKDNADGIALVGGDDDERNRLDATFSELVQRWFGVIVWQGRMMWVNGANLVLAPVVPLLLGAPKYLSGDMTLGSLIQAATAFAQVQLALNWLADNAMRVADWLAASHRVTQLSDAMDRLEQRLGPVGRGETIRLGPSPNACIILRDLNIAVHDGELGLESAEIVIAPGEKLLVKGEPGSGKSTLIRAVAGLWPWGRGEILLPADAEAVFMPQRPYFPIGTLRVSLLYPHQDQDVADDVISDILMRCGLEHLIASLDKAEQWNSFLSNSEQQRLSFARVLIRPPAILIMDEPTSSLDELSQFKLMEYMRDMLPTTTVIHAGHRAGLDRFHDRQIRLVRSKVGN